MIESKNVVKIMSAEDGRTEVFVNDVRLGRVTGLTIRPDGARPAVDLVMCLQPGELAAVVSGDLGIMSFDPGVDAKFRDRVADLMVELDDLRNSTNDRLDELESRIPITSKPGSQSEATPGDLVRALEPVMDTAGTPDRVYGNSNSVSDEPRSIVTDLVNKLVGAELRPLRDLVDAYSPPAPATSEDLNRAVGLVAEAAGTPTEVYGSPESVSRYNMIRRDDDAARVEFGDLPLESRIDITYEREVSVMTIRDAIAGTHGLPIDDTDLPGWYVIVDADGDIVCLVSPSSSASTQGGKVIPDALAITVRDAMNRRHRHQ